MSTYEGLKGLKVKYIDGDTSGSRIQEGEIYYNSSNHSKALKSHVAIGSWSAAANLNVTTRLMADFGTQGAGVSAGGDGPGYVTATEEYNGVGWSSGGTIVGTYNAAGVGVLTAGLSVGGNKVADSSRSELTYEYDGSSWTAGGNLTEEREGGCAFGTQTAGVACGGESLFPASEGGVQYVTSTDEYNGTAWSAVNAMANKRYIAGASGPNTAGIAFGTADPYSGLETSVEEYDGTHWTNAATCPTAQKYYTAAAGPQTSALLTGGNSATTTNSIYDGIAFSVGATLGTARFQHGMAKSETTNLTALVMGGLEPPARFSICEEYNTVTSAITGAAWASGGNMTSGRGGGGDCGIYTAGLVFGGNPGEAPYTTANSEEYNGSAWSEGNNLGHAASDVSGAGTQTAAVAFAFSDNPTASTQEYNGTSWSEVNDLPGNQAQGRGIGIQTAALLVGYGSPGVATSEYDGTNWTAGGNHNNKRSGQKPGGWGTQTSAILASGYQTPPAVIITNTELYNGTSWTETGHAVVQGTKRTSATTAGTSTSGMLMGGGIVAGDNTTSSLTQAYNGTVWVTSANLATARINPQGFGTTSNAVVCGATNATEEFTGETTAVNAAKSIDFD